MKRFTGLATVVISCTVLALTLGITFAPIPVLADGGGPGPPHNLPGDMDTIPDTLPDPTGALPDNPVDPCDDCDLWLLELSVQAAMTVTK